MQSPYSLRELLDMEQEKNFGEKTLGKLASCFMDSLSTLGVQAVGYGLRSLKDGISANPNEHCVIKQKLKKNPFEVERKDIQYSIRLYGDVNGQESEIVMARAFDTPITGYKSGTINTMRLWKSYPL